MEGVFHLLAVDLDIGDIVLEDGGHVHLGELVLREDDEEARLPAGTVTHDNQLLADRCHPQGWLKCLERNNIFIIVYKMLFIQVQATVPVSRLCEMFDGNVAMISDLVFSLN